MNPLDLSLSNLESIENMKMMLTRVVKLEMTFITLYIYVKC